MEQSISLPSDAPCTDDYESLVRHYNRDCVFDVRVDSLSNRALYLVSSVNPAPSSDDFTSFSGVSVALATLLHVEGRYYIPPTLTSDHKELAADEWSDYVRRNIFWNDSEAIQLDEDAYVDASWEGEATDVAQYTLGLIRHDKLGGLTSCEEAFVEANRERDTSLQSYSDDVTRVIDLTCGVGGNLVPLAKFYDFAVGVDLNPKRVEMCKNNLEIHHVGHKAVVVPGNLLDWAQGFLEDCKSGYEKLNRPDLYRPNVYPFDWTFISPPWGGKNYSGSCDSNAYYMKTTSAVDMRRAVSLISLLSRNFTAKLPKSQSLSELVQIAFENGYTSLIITGYTVPHFNNKIRCVYVHFIRDVLCMPEINVLEAKPSLLNKCEKTSVKGLHCGGIFHLIPLTRQVSNVLGTCNVLPLEFVLNGLFRILKESEGHVRNKLSVLVTKMPLANVLGHLSIALAIQFTGGDIRNDTSDRLRTIGGVFFKSLKDTSNVVYKYIESVCSAGDKQKRKRTA